METFQVLRQAEEPCGEKNVRSMRDCSHLVLVPGTVGGIEQAPDKRLLNLLGVWDFFLNPDTNFLYDSQQITPLFLASFPCLALTILLNSGMFFS